MTDLPFNPYAARPMAPPHQRRVVPPSTQAVQEARLRFCEAKQAAVECEFECDPRLAVEGDLAWEVRMAVHEALDAWIDAEHEARA